MSPNTTAPIGRTASVSVIAEGDLGRASTSADPAKKHARGLDEQA